MPEVRYKCACMQTEQSVHVPPRVPNTDIEPWLELMQHCLGYHHHAISPRCRRTAMEYAKIHVEPGADGIGEQGTRQ